MKPSIAFISLHQTTKLRVTGFSFIEVLVAMLIFTMAVVAAVSMTKGSVQATLDSQKVTQATWLVEGLMTELETKLETHGIEKGCERKKEGKFDAPNEGFFWKTECYPIDFQMSKSLSQFLNKAEQSSSEQENVILNAIIDLSNQYIKRSLREIHAEVSWMQGKNRRKVTLTTHFVKYDELIPSLAIPSLDGNASN